MSGELRDMMSRRATDVELPDLVLADLMASGELRLRRRRGAVVATGVAAVLVVAAGALTLGDSDHSAPTPPSETPTVTPTGIDFVIPAGQTTVQAEIGPGDVRGWAVLDTQTNTQAGHEGDAVLSSTVTLHTDRADSPVGVSYYCRGSSDLWFIADEGFEGDGAARCSPDADDSLPAPTDIPDWTHAHAPEALSVTMFIGKPSTDFIECTRGNRPTSDCSAAYPVQPITNPDAEFGFRIYEHQSAPYVMTLFGVGTEAYQTMAGEGWLLDRAVYGAAGSDRVAVVLPDAPLRRIVGAYQELSPHYDVCLRQHADEIPDSDADREGYIEASDRLCGVSVRLLVDGAYENPHVDSLGFVGRPWMYVEPGRHEVEVVVVRGDARNVELALVIRKEKHLGTLGNP